MTIRKGDEWGTPRSAEVNERRVSNDSELAHIGYKAHREHTATEMTPFSLESGDVLRTLGISVQRQPKDQIVFPFDLGLVRLDGGDQLPFAAHVLVRSRFWSDKFATIMNVGWQGENYFGPRAHPNDGLIDITEGSLSVQQRLLARGRLRTGTHLPHPDLKTIRRSAHTLNFSRPTPTFVDGAAVGRYSTVEVDIIADAFYVVA